MELHIAPAAERCCQLLETIAMYATGITTLVSSIARVAEIQLFPVMEEEVHMHGTEKIG